MDVQHKLIVCGNTKVFFPFEPYETQKNYMKSVVEALDKRQNALLESPTGTGKTLSLLCSSLAWVQTHTGGQNQSIIYYTSRTHMQLSQAAKELKRTAYSRVPSVVLGSRVQMCLNEEVRSTDPSLINRTCRNSIARNACAYYTNYEQKLETMDQNTVHDIEDLADFGKKHQCCPYYASKKLAESKATIIFMPYNYLLDTSVRKSTQLKIDNSVIIFDEAHNIESALKDSVSGSFTESSLKVVQESCDILPAKVHEALNKEKHGLSRAGYNPKDKPGAIVDEFAKKKPGKQKEKEVKVNPIEELAEKLTNVKLQQVKDFAGLLTTEMKNLDADKLCNIETAFRIMQESGIKFSSSSQIITTLESMASFWSIAGVMNPSYVARHVSAISNLCHVLSILFPEVCMSLVHQEEHQRKLLKFYTVYVKGIYQASNHFDKGRLKDREINFWCLHPAIGLKKVFESTSIFGPRSMIVTSGTLEPMKSIQKELEIDFKIQRSFEHVIGGDQLKILLLNESFKKFNLVSDFKGLSRPQFPKELGETLQSIVKILPYGTLIFFPSYTFMNLVVKAWKTKSSVWKDLTSICPVYQEQGNQDQFMSDVSAYKRTTSSSGSNCRAIFLCVVRGKLSEGINLEGNQCRTVVVVGLPFPNYKDPKVESTKKFHEGRGYTLWYKEQMRRALNQTIGRVIRSRTDFGLLLLVDPRFIELKYSLSEWTLKFYPSRYVQTNRIDREVKEFFNLHGIEITQTVTRNMGTFELEDLGSLSPFSEEGDDETPQQAIQQKTISAVERQAAMVAQYREARETIRSQQAAQPVAMAAKSPEQNAAKRQKTTADAFHSIYNQSQSTSSNHSFETATPGLSSQGSFTNGNSLTSSSQVQPCIPAVSSSGQIPSSLGVPNSQTLSHSEVVPFSPILPPSQNSQSSQSSLPSRSTSSLPNSASTQNTLSTNYSIIKQASDKDRPTTHKCCICKSEANRPHTTGCECDRVGCERCIILLAGRKCYGCDKMLRKRDFKPRLFKSAFFQDERTPVIVVDHPGTSARAK